MALNITNAEVERLADELSGSMRLPKTEVIRQALRELQNKVAMFQPAGDRHERWLRFLESQIWPGLPEEASRRAGLIGVVSRYRCVVHGTGLEKPAAEGRGSVRCGIGATTVAEANMVATSKRGPGARALVARLLEGTRAVIVPFGADHPTLLNDLFRRFGEGHHPAALNFPRTDLALA